MKQYVIDQLRESDHELMNEYLRKNAEKTIFDEVFRIDLPEHLYTEVQKGHSACSPFYFAVNLSRTQVAFELLIRSRQVMRCQCIGYADSRQLSHIIDYADRMLETLEIKV